MELMKLQVQGQEFIAIPRADFETLMERAGVLPSLPVERPEGGYPALETSRILIARQIITRRIAVGMSQRELAQKAGIRVESLSRMESGKHKPQQESLLRIDRALRQAEAAPAVATSSAKPRPAARRTARTVRKPVSRVTKRAKA